MLYRYVKMYDPAIQEEKPMGKFNFIKTDIPEVQIIEPTVFGDDRGYFMETYQISDCGAHKAPR